MRALSFLWGEEFCIKKCKCFLLIAHDAVYISLCFVFWPYTVIHGISYYTILFPFQNTWTNASKYINCACNRLSSFCMFDSHLKIWTNEIEKTKPQYIPIPILDHHWLYFPYLKYIQTLPSQNFALLFSTSFCSLSQNNFAAISHHICATRMLLVRTWTVLAILHERPVASSLCCCLGQLVQARQPHCKLRIRFGSRWPCRSHRSLRIHGGRSQQHGHGRKDSCFLVSFEQAWFWRWSGTFVPRRYFEHGSRIERHVFAGNWWGVDAREVGFGPRACKVAAMEVENLPWEALPK